MEGRDIKAPSTLESNITIQEIKGVFPRELRVESSESSVSDTNFVKTVAFKQLLWQHFEKESLELIRQKKQQRPLVDNDILIKEIEDEMLNMFDALTPAEGREIVKKEGILTQ